MHRHLPSFPTRRSSDLAWVCSLSHGHPSGPRKASTTRTRPAKSLKFLGATGIPRPHVFDPYLCLKLVIAMLYHESMRSEEHTSELQSPCNLVCRLLLEN